MLNSISWQEFFIISASIIGGYYAIVILTMYGKEITRWLKSGDKKEETASTLGPIKSDANHSYASVQSDEIHLLPEEQQIPQSLIDEIKIITDSNASPEEISTLFSTLLSNHADFIDTPAQDEITTLIYNSLKGNYPFTTSQIAQWWPTISTH